MTRFEYLANIGQVLTNYRHIPVFCLLDLLASQLMKMALMAVVMVLMVVVMVLMVVFVAALL